MKQSKQIIEDAIKGGYDTSSLLGELGIRQTYRVEIGMKYMTVTTHQGNTKKLCDFAYLLLKPEVWQAVGKTRGWEEKLKKKDLYKDCNGRYFKPSGRPERFVHVGGGTYEPYYPHWLKNWHQLIDHLAEGDDIETSLSKINNH